MLQYLLLYDWMMNSFPNEIKIEKRKRDERGAQVAFRVRLTNLDARNEKY